MEKTIINTGDTKDRRINYARPPSTILSNNHDQTLSSPLLNSKATTKEQIIELTTLATKILSDYLTPNNWQDIALLFENNHCTIANLVKLANCINLHSIVARNHIQDQVGNKYYHANTINQMPSGKEMDDFLKAIGIHQTFRPHILNLCLHVNDREKTGYIFGTYRPEVAEKLYTNIKKLLAAKLTSNQSLDKPEHTNT
jgi:hypothetical protein